MNDESLRNQLENINISKDRKRRVSFSNYSYEYDAGYDSDDDSSDDDSHVRSFKKLKINDNTDNKKNYVPIKKNNGLNTSRVYSKAFNLIKSMRLKKELEEEQFEKDLNYINNKIKTSNGFAGDINNNRNIVMLPCTTEENVKENIKVIK